MKHRKYALAMLMGFSAILAHPPAMSDTTARDCSEDKTVQLPFNASPTEVTNRIENHSKVNIWVQDRTNQHAPPAGEWLAPQGEYANQTDRHQDLEFTVIFKDEQKNERQCTYSVKMHKASGKYDSNQVTFADYQCSGNKLPDVRIACEEQVAGSKDKVVTTFTISDR